jgi:hypothetical protein
MLMPYLASGQLTLLLEHIAESATVMGDRASSVVLRDKRRGLQREIAARFFIDATDLGDLLPLTKTEFVTGAESQAQTGELHAPAESQPGNSQSFTFCFAMDYLQGEDHTIARPTDYGFWRDYVPKLIPSWTGRLLSWSMCDPKTLSKRDAYFDPNADAPQRPALNLWTYRRIADQANFLPGTYRSSITLVNWPQNDYWLGDLVTASAGESEDYLTKAKQLSLSLLYWMQTDAPRPDGGAGWKGLRLRKDVVDTEDGLAKAPYIRESRRIKAEFTILEQHVGTEMRRKETGLPEPDLSAVRFYDSAGVGCYRIDLHPSAGGTNYIDISSLPFQIPLGALIPVRVDNLLAASKNIGTTHITNGCYRLHPVEWNIGEAAGALAAHAFHTKQIPRAVRADGKKLADFQSLLLQQGFELAWPHIHPV